MIDDLRLICSQYNHMLQFITNIKIEHPSFNIHHILIDKWSSGWDGFKCTHENLSIPI